MKRLILFILMLLFLSGTLLPGQSLQERLHYQAQISVGSPLPDSDISPWSCLISADYAFHPRLAAGIGTGLSHYDTWLLPCFASLRWDMTSPHRITPYLSSHLGFAMALNHHAHGGFYGSPAFGLRYTFMDRQSLSLSLGYTLQEYEQLITYTSPSLFAQYVEHVSNHALTLSLGWSF